MQDAFDITTLIFLALAVFVIWRLRSVLGQKTGREQPPLDPFARRDTPEAPRAAASADNVVPRPRGVGEPPGAAARAAEGWAGVPEPQSPIARGLDEIA